MNDPIIVVNSPRHFNLQLDNTEIISARDYISNPEFQSKKDARVYNLCSSYKYQSWGYYVSLLADARGHNVSPSVAAMQDFKSQTIVRSISEELEHEIQRVLKKLKSDKFELSIYFGKNLAKQYDTLAAQLHKLFQAPLMRATFVKSAKDQIWEMQNISPISISDVPDEHLPYLSQFAKRYFGKQASVAQRNISRPFYDLAILVDPEEHEPPSNQKAIEFFMKAALEQNIRPELITKDDYSRIPEFDALFIRTTTSVNHYTYRFSRYAQTEGLALIDDPISMLKCTNKIYLAELLAQANIAAPKTYFIHKRNLDEMVATLDLPLVLKEPDGSFSKGVMKVTNKAEFLEKANTLLKDSDLILGQEFTPSKFDWRVTILDNKVLFVCKQNMARNHWQIYNWKTKSKRNWGTMEPLAVSETPKQVLETALASTRIIGDGLYGVDLKEVDGRVLVIEVNDNPTIENRIEDKVLKFELYMRIIESFTNRVRKLNEMHKVQI